MSGSGGGGGGGGGAGDPIPCESLAFETQLSSPKADVIKGIVPGNVLNIDLKLQGSAYTIIVLCDGQLAGGLTAPDVQRLRECILAGFKYGATVLSVNEGQVKVRVKALSS
nr:hypothetical protein [Rhodoferax sp.]